MVENNSEYVTLTPLHRTDPIYFEGTKLIDNPAFEFDLPVEDVVNRFKEELVNQAANQTWDNNYDGFEIFHLKAKKAIQDVIDHTDPRVDECSTPDAVIENIGPQAEQRYDTWESVAEAWIREWIRLYNSILRERTEDDIEQLRSAIANATANPLIREEDFPTI
jgi:hypothetical protein